MEEILYLIRLDSIKKVKNFIKEIEQFESDFYIKSGRYIVDGKSIMGIFSLDLSKNLTINVEFNDSDNYYDVLNFINKYRVL